MELHITKHVLSIDKTDIHGDGDGLYLKLMKSGIYRVELNCKRREMRLGGANVAGGQRLDRQLTTECGVTIVEGKDPIALRKFEVDAKADYVGYKNHTPSYF